MDKLWSTQELANFLDLPVQTIYQCKGRPGDPHAPPRAHILMHAIAQRITWRTEYDRAMTAATGPPPGNETSTWGERYRVLVNLGAGCGLRQGEVFGLSPDDVDEESGVIRIERQIKIVRSRMVLGLPKHRKKREVPLPASVLKAIKEHQKCFPALQVALPWEEPAGKPITVELLVYTREHKRLYRHSFIQPLCLEAGAPVGGHRRAKSS